VLALVKQRLGEKEKGEKEKGTGMNGTKIRRFWDAERGIFLGGQ
jgi:hypothetical protein